jgi:alpha-tubulin suppressor-like RCC1 family protein
MFGLPILRRRTPSGAETPKCLNELYGCDPKEPQKLKSALRLAQMVYNHYSIIISSDWQRIATWGSTPSTPIYGRTGVTTVSNKPQTAVINWKNGLPKSIVKVFSYGYNNYTIFRTEDNQLYGTGNNAYYILNKSTTAIRNAFEFITDDVIDFCVAGQSNTGGIHYMLYVKSNGKVYGLGPKNVGFGFSSTNQKALTFDNNKDLNYLGIDNASKVFCTTPDGGSKSFILKKDGTALACGYNFKGSLGVDINDNIIYEFTPVKYYNGTTYVPLTGIVDIITTNWVHVGGANTTAVAWKGGSADTFSSTYFLTKDGSVYTCGSNKFGQLGLGLIDVNETRNYAVKTSLTGVNSFCTTAGGTSILATTIENEVYTWGNNQWGQLGLGHTNNVNIPTKIVFPNKKIKMVHGGGMYGVINGAFLIVCDDGTIYGAGFNQTYALGLTLVGTTIPDPGPITTFRKNEYFGVNPEQNQDPQRYPLILSGVLVENDTIIRNAELKEIKDITIGSTKFNNQSIYVQVGMTLSGYGIQSGTEVLLIDDKNNEITLTKPITADVSIATIRYDQKIKVVQADLCGYGTEMAQKVVTEDGTLYMSGWNQNLGGIYNFNYYIGTENVQVPTYFDAKFK